MNTRVSSVVAEVIRGLETCPELSHLGDPVLRLPAAQVEFHEGVRIAEKLIKVLDRYRTFSGVGAGLAAPQIGISKSVFVTTGKSGFEIYINPRLISSSSQVNYYRESCLSSRAMWSDIERPESVEISWTDGSGADHQEKFGGFRARLIQHEYDHLLGIPCLDRSLPGTIAYSGSVKEEKLRDSG